MENGRALRHNWPGWYPLLFIGLFVLAPVARAQILSPPFSTTRMERICDDHLDNDRDGRTDCRDADCATLPACVDTDSDKYPLSKDCNDVDPRINPGASEACNGIDDDCDGLLDDADSSLAFGLRTFYADTDADTHGDILVTKTACNRPANYVPLGDDCDDTDAAVFPNAAETCNGKDDDCDGLTDDADSSVTGLTAYYRDSDNDTHGDASVTLNACAIPDGYSATADDCDDTSALCYTGATEACADAADNECDGATDCADSDCAAAKICLSPWPYFHGNPQHTGESPYNGPQTATVKWKYKFTEMSTGGDTSGELQAPKNFVIDKQNRVFANAGYTVIAFNGSDGSVVWSKDLGVEEGSVALSADQSVVYAFADTDLYALNADSGAQLWVFTDPTAFCHGEILVAGDGTIFIGCNDTYVYAVNADGSAKWAYQTDGAFAPLASPTLSPDESVVYLGSGDPNYDNGGTLYALAVADGTVLWQQSINNIRASGAVVDAEGSVYVAGNKRTVTKFTSGGTAVWQSDENTASALTPALYAGGSVYSGTGEEGILYALDAATGATRWSYQTGENSGYDSTNSKAPQYGVVTASVIGADGVVYVGAMDGVMYALKSDGSVLWTYATGKRLDENCPAIGADGTLYFSGGDSYIYAIGE